MTVLTYKQAYANLTDEVGTKKIQTWYGYHKGTVKSFESKNEAEQFGTFVELVETEERTVPWFGFKERTRVREAVIESVLATYRITRAQYNIIAGCECALDKYSCSEDYEHGDFDKKIARIVCMINMIRAVNASDFETKSMIPYPPTPASTYTIQLQNHENSTNV